MRVDVTRYIETHRLSEDEATVDLYVSPLALKAGNQGFMLFFFSARSAMPAAEVFAWRAVPHFSTL